MIDAKLLEKLIIKGCMTDTNYLATLSSSFTTDYFDDATAGKIYGYVSNHFKEYKNIVPRDIVIAEYDKDGNTDVQDFFKELDSVEFDYVKNYSFLFDSTNDYLKEKAVKKSILSSVDVVNSGEDISSIRHLVEDALCKDLKIDLGTDYFGELAERLARVMGPGQPKVPTGFPVFDEYISGGLPPYTLSIILAKIHGCKSAFLANMSARQVLMGKNVVLVSLEMSEDAFAQRFDAIFSLLDINKMYREKPLKKRLIKTLGELKKTEGLGRLFIKQYPTGKATIEDYRKYLRELKIRGINPDIFVCDYLNLMKSSYKSRGDMYTDVKSISEELRALSYEFVIPVVSVSQLNREGMRISFDEIDFTYISESVGVMATSDLSVIFGGDEDKAVYECEIFYKIVKNRLGGMVGVIDKLYLDQRNLKMYDVSEQDVWMDDAKISNDTRKMVEIKTDSVVNRSKGKKSQRRS